MLEFENIMVKFHEHVYVVPYEYHWECYEMLKCGHDIRLGISGCVGLLVLSNGGS